MVYEACFRADIGSSSFGFAPKMDGVFSFSILGLSSPLDDSCPASLGFYVIVFRFSNMAAIFLTSFDIFNALYYG